MDLEQKEKVILYGLGSRMKRCLRQYRLHYNIIALSDSNTKKAESLKEEMIPFIKPEQICELEFDTIIITSTYYDEISSQLINKYHIPSTKIVPDYLKVFELYKKNIIAMGNKNKDKIIGVIKNKDPKQGLFSIYRIALCYIKELVSLGYLPVVDMQTIGNAYLNPDKLGLENSWEYYFEQPSGISVTEAHVSAHVIDTSNIPLVTNLACNFDDVLKSKKIRQFYSRLSSEYIRMKPTIKTIIEQRYQNIFSKVPKGEKVCGILFRGSDYSKLKPYMHQIQPSIDMVIDKVTKLSKEWGFSYLFVATEDENALTELKKNFQNRILYLERLRFQDTGKELLADIDFQRENDRYIKGLDYLTEMILLSKCNFIIAGKATGTYGAAILSEQYGGYEKEFYFDLGFYGIDDDSILYKKVTIKR